MGDSSSAGGPQCSIVSISPPLTYQLLIEPLLSHVQQRKHKSVHSGSLGTQPHDCASLGLEYVPVIGDRQKAMFDAY